MRQRRVIPLLSLAGLSLLQGCADSTAPSRATSKAGSRPSHDESAVVVAHFEAAPVVGRSLKEPTNLPPRQHSSDICRLPSVYPLTYPIAGRPPSTRAQQPAVAERSFDRLPDLACAASAEPCPYAIDLTGEHESVLTSRTVSLLPSIVKVVSEKEKAPEPVVPKRRFVAAKAPKPSLPPLTKPSAAAPSGSAGWLTVGTSLVAVSQRADGMIDRGFLLAEKGAYYSAQTEFKQALRTISQALDTHFGGNHYSEALAAGWLALEEAGDFSARSQRGPVVDVESVVESHQSTLLKDYSMDDVSPVLAMQHYFSFAQEQLVEACGRAPVASRALYGLGKIHMVLGEKSSSAERLHGPKAMAFQQAALTTDPGNYLAANELGVLLARFGKLQDARAALQHSVALRPLPETWQNLSVVHQRLGEADLAAQAHANWQIALQPTGGPSPMPQADSRSMVQWVSPQAFIGQPPGGPNAPPATAPTMPYEQPEQAKRKTGFLWW